MVYHFANFAIKGAGSLNFERDATDMKNVKVKCREYDSVNIPIS